MQKFKVSEDFAKFEAVSASRLEEARKAEKQARGCDLPVGTQGQAVVSDMSTLKLKKKNEAGQEIEYLAIAMNFTILTPEKYKGKSQSRMFALDDHPKFSTTQKMQQFLDFCENAGLPREVRLKPTADVFGWFGAETRQFDYLVKENKGYSNIEAIGKTELPVATTPIQATFAVGDKITAFGHPFTIVSINGDKIKGKSLQSGQEMDLDVSNVSMM